MSFLDIVIGILLVWGLYKGASNGLFVELAALIALVAGIYGAIHFSFIAGDYLSKNINWNENYIKITAFLATFLLIVIIVHLAGKFLTNAVDGTALLGVMNKVAGGIFGAVKVAVIIGAILVFIERATSSLNFINSGTKKESILYEPVKNVGAFVFSKVLKDQKINEKKIIKKSPITL